MNMQPLLAILLVIALGGCGVQTVPPEVAPIPVPLYSEFQVRDENGSFYGPFLAATQAQQDAEYTKSADFYMQALAADPTSKFVADRAFFQLLYGGNTEKAAALAAQMVESGLDEDDDLIRLMYVLAAYKAENWAAVRERLGEGSSSGFGFIITPLLRAWSYGAEGDLEAAKAALMPLLNDERLKSIAEEHTAYLLDYMKEYEAAEVQYVLLTNADPPISLQPTVAYAHMLYRKGDRAKARTFLGEQILRYKKHNFLLREGSRITRGDRPTQAAATPRGAAAMVFFRLATEFAQGKSTQAAVLYSRIASYLAPEVSDVYFLLGDLMEQNDSMDAAAAAFNKVPLDSPMRSVADARRIDALRIGGRIELAEQLIRNKLRKTPKSIGMLLSLADILQRRGAFEESITTYSKVIDSLNKPKVSDWRIYYARAISYENLKNWPRAEEDLLSALSINPEQPTVLNHLGYTWIDKGLHIAKAKKMIETAVAARPDDGFIVDSLGWAYYLTGDYEGAVETLEKAVRLEPDDVTINDHLGDAYWRVGRKIEARFQWRHAVDSGADGAELAVILQKIEAGIEEPS